MGHLYLYLRLKDGLDNTVINADIKFSTSTQLAFLWFILLSQVRLKCVQSLISVCQHADRSVSTALIHAVALPILDQLIQHATADKPRDDAEVSIIMEGMRLAEVLVSLADEQTSKELVDDYVLHFAIRGLTPLLVLYRGWKEPFVPCWFCAWDERSLLPPAGFVSGMKGAFWLYWFCIGDERSLFPPGCWFSVHPSLTCTSGVTMLD